MTNCTEGIKMATDTTNWVTLLGNIGSFFAGIGALVAAGAARRSAESAVKSTESNEKLVQITHADVLATHLAHFNDILDSLRPELIQTINKIGTESKILQGLIISELEKTCNKMTVSNIYYSSSAFTDMARQIYDRCYHEDYDKHVGYYGLSEEKYKLRSNENLKISVHSIDENEVFELIRRIESNVTPLVSLIKSSEVQLNGIKEKISNAVEKSNHRRINIRQDPIMNTQFVLINNYINRVELLRDLLCDKRVLGDVSNWQSDKPIIHVINIIALCSALYLAPNEIEYQLSAGTLYSRQ
jgi:hypothetical protein